MLHDVPLGTDVRARITGAASDRVSPLVGSFDTRVLVGAVVENSGGNMTLEVPTGARPNVTADVIQLRARVPLAPGDLVSLEQRRLDVGRSWLLAGSIVGAVGLGAFLAFHSWSDAQAGNLPNEPPPITRIPVVRFHF